MSSASVKSLLRAVKQLSPQELREFVADFADWQQGNGISDETLVEMTKLKLAKADDERLRTLAGKSERGSLTDAELMQFRKLAARAERLNMQRVQALAELARRREQPLSAVMQEVAWDTTDCAKIAG